MGITQIDLLPDDLLQLAPNAMTNAPPGVEALLGLPSPGGGNLAPAENFFQRVIEAFDFARAEEFPRSSPRALLPRRLEELSPALLSEDPKRRMERCRERVHGARARASLDHRYLLLYRIALNGQAHLYTVRDHGGTGCYLERINDSDWLLADLNISANWIRGIIEEIASRLNISGSVFHAYPRTRSAEDANAARLVTKLGKFLADTPELSSLYTKHALILPVEGTTFSRVEWDRKALSTIRGANGEALRGAYGWADIDILSRLNMRLPEGLSRPDFEDAPWAGDVQLYPWHWLARRYPEAAARIDPDCQKEDQDDYNLLMEARELDAYGESASVSNWGRAAGRSRSGGERWRAGWRAAEGGMGDIAPDLQVVVTRYFERVEDPNLGPYIQRTLFCQDIELESLPWAPLETIDGKTYVKLQSDGKPKVFNMPYQACRYYELPDTLNGASVTRDMIDIDRALKGLYVLAMKMGFDASNTFIMYHNGDSLSPLYTRGMTHLKYHLEPPQFERQESQLQEMVYTIHWLEDVLQAVAMRPDVKRGELPASGTSGRAVNALVYQADGAWGNIRARNYEFWRRTLSAAIEQIQWNAAQDVILRGVGEEDVSGSESFRGADLSGATDLRLRLQYELPDDPEARVAFAERLQAAGWIGPDEARMLAIGGANLEEIDSMGRSQELARNYISTILSFPEEVALAAVEMIDFASAMASQAEMLKLAEEAALGGAATLLPAANSASLELAGRKARNQILQDLEIGVEDFHDAFWQLKVTAAWLNSLAAQTVPAGNKALVMERFGALMDRVSVIPSLLRGQSGGPVDPQPAPLQPSPAAVPRGGEGEGGGGNPSPPPPKKEKQ